METALGAALRSFDEIVLPAIWPARIETAKPPTAEYYDDELDDYDDEDYDDDEDVDDEDDYDDEAGVAHE